MLTGKQFNDKYKNILLLKFGDPTITINGWTEFTSLLHAYNHCGIDNIVSLVLIPNNAIVFEYKNKYLTNKITIKQKFKIDQFIPFQTNEFIEKCANVGINIFKNKLITKYKKPLFGLYNLLSNHPRSNGFPIIHIPINDITYLMYEKLLVKYPLSYKYIPKQISDKFMSFELCKKIINNHSFQIKESIDFLKIIPQTYKTDIFYSVWINKKNYITIDEFKNISPDLLKSQLCLALVLINSELIEYIPSHLTTYSMYYTMACHQYKIQQPLLFVPPDFQTFEIIQQLFMNKSFMFDFHFYNSFEIVKNFSSEQLQTYYDYIMYYRMDFNNIPEKYMSQHGCNQAVNYDGKILNYIPARFKNAELYNYIHSSFKGKIDYGIDIKSLVVNISEKFLTPEMLLYAIKNEKINKSSKCIISYQHIQEFIEYYKLDNIYSEIINKNSKLIRYVPSKFITISMAKKCITDNMMFIQYIPSDILKQIC